MRNDKRAPRIQKWTAGIDYFRYRTRELADTGPLLDAIYDRQRQDRERASSFTRWSFQGYNGWQSDSIRWGQRNGNVLWESSGETTHSTLGLAALCSGWASRIDLQITLCLERSQVGFGTFLAGSIGPNSNSSRWDRTSRTQLTGTSGLWLGTVGRRTNKSYFRVYDKGVESKTAAPGLLWRVELETKKSHAEELCKTHLRDLTDPSFCAGYLEQSWKSQGYSWPLGPFSAERIDVRTGSRRRSTPQTLASWLVLSVAPVVKRLLTVFTVAEVLEMLSLSDVAAPIAKDDA